MLVAGIPLLITVTLVTKVVCGYPTQLLQRLETWSSYKGPTLERKEWNQALKAYSMLEYTEFYLLGSLRRAFRIIKSLLSHEIK